MSSFYHMLKGADVVRAFLVGGTQSRSGKTSVSLGLCRALTRRGLKVQPFKCGPDYLDPTYLALAAGRPCYNLDVWMNGRDYVRGLFSAAISGAMGDGAADVALIEGAMGLYDGLRPESAGNSAASLAAELGVPVLLLAPCSSQSRSFAAQLNGFVHFPDAPNFLGVAANLAGSERHGELVRRAAQSVPGLPPFLGAVVKGDLPELGSRHLGLVRADSDFLRSGSLDELADAIEKRIDIDALLAGAAAVQPAAVAALPGREGAEFPGARTGWHAGGRRLRLAVASDDALHFYYPDALAALARSGFEIVYFSPLRDAALPEGTDGVYLGGGYPECYGPELGANTGMIAALRAFAENGGTVYGECGGLMYLARSIELANGEVYPMCGILPARIRMRRSLHALGLVTAQMCADNPLGMAGGDADTIRGHEYHYSEIVGEVPPEWRRAFLMRKQRDGAEATGWGEGYLCKRTLASYLHMNFAAYPSALAAFYRFCAGEA